MGVSIGALPLSSLLSTLGKSGGAQSSPTLHLTPRPTAGPLGGCTRGRISWNSPDFLAVRKQDLLLLPPTSRPSSSLLPYNSSSIQAGTLLGVERGTINHWTTNVNWDVWSRHWTLQIIGVRKASKVRLCLWTASSGQEAPTCWFQFQAKGPLFLPHPGYKQVWGLWR